MKKKLFGSLALAGTLFTGANATDIDVFGHIGGFFNQGLGEGNKVYDFKDDSNKKAGYAGITGQLGIDVGFGNLHIGASGWGAFPVYGSPSKSAGYDGVNTDKNYGFREYNADYGDLSDLYVKYDGNIQLALGRFDNSFLNSDWLTAHTQGVAAKWDAKNFGVWATWINDYSTFGYQPNRFGSELSSFRQYKSSFNHFGFGNDLFAGGVNIDLDWLKIDPFVHYWIGGFGYNYDSNGNVNGSNPMIQAGTKVALEFGNDMSVKSITTGRFLWQNILNANNDDTYLIWGDEELRFKNIVKVGAGWFGVGKNNGIFAMNDNTRFYGWRYLTGNNSNYYFGRAESSWYAFAGIDTDIINFDVLYANGDYNEFSAIVSWNVFKTKNDLALQIGGGYVSNGFQSKERQQNNVVAFAKFSF